MARRCGPARRCGKLLNRLRPAQCRQEQPRPGFEVAAAPEAVRRLVATADVLVENFRPGVMRRFELDHASLHGLNPKLIYCSISGYGQTGPSAASGLCAGNLCIIRYDLAHLAYQTGRSGPDYRGTYHADVLTGAYAFGAIMAALYQRAAPARARYRRLDAGSDVEPYLERNPSGAVPGEADAAADFRPDRDDGRLRDDGDRQRENFPEPDAGDRSPGVGERSALCEIFRSAGKLGEADRRLERGRALSCQRSATLRSTSTACPRRPTAPLPRRCRPAARPPRRAGRSQDAGGSSARSTCRSASQSPKCRRRDACRRSVSTRVPT